MTNGTLLGLYYQGVLSPIIKQNDMDGKTPDALHKDLLIKANVSI
jgi:hypothetical protein